jgi:hypothetical protein
MSAFCQAVVYLLVALPAVAQSQAFATITIKPSRSADSRNARMQLMPNGDLIASAVPVITLLSYAYDVPSNPTRPLLRSTISKRKRPPTPLLPVFRTAEREAELSK